MWDVCVANLAGVKSVACYTWLSLISMCLLCHDKIKTKTRSNLLKHELSMSANTLSPSLSVSYTHTHSYSHIPLHTHTHTFILSLSPFLPPSLSLPLPPSLPPPLSLSLFPLSFSQTHRHTNANIHVHTIQEISHGYCVDVLCPDCQYVRSSSITILLNWMFLLQYHVNLLFCILSTVLPLLHHHCISSHYILLLFLIRQVAHTWLVECD